MIHDDRCQCVSCRADIEETFSKSRCCVIGCGVVLGSPGDAEGFCRNCLAHVRAAEREAERTAL